MGWPIFKAKLPKIEELETAQKEAMQYQQLKEALQKDRGLEHYQQRQQDYQRWQLEQAKQLQDSYQAQILGYGSLGDNFPYGLGGLSILGGSGETQPDSHPLFKTIEKWLEWAD